MMSMSAKSDSINERTQEISQLTKLHILGVWQNVHEFITYLVNALTSLYNDISGEKINVNAVVSRKSREAIPEML